MKKVLALSLFFAIISFSASAQKGMNPGMRKHRIEHKQQNRNFHFNHPVNTKLRKEVLHHRIMKQRAQRNKNLRGGDERKLGAMQMHSHRKMMMRRHNPNRRVI